MALLIPFLIVAGLFVVTPGPDVALVTRNAFQLGRRSALQTALGITTGISVWAGATSIGLATVLQANAVAFMLVKLAGAAYLGYLGMRALLSLRASRRDKPMSYERRISWLKIQSPYLQGLVNNILNPKVAVLFTTLIPQFVTSGPSESIEFLELAGIFAVMGLCALSAYSILGSVGRDFLRRTSVRKVFDGLTGSVLVAFAVWTAFEAR